MTYALSYESSNGSLQHSMVVAPLCVSMLLLQLPPAAITTQLASGGHH